MLSVDKAEVVIDIVELVNVTMPAPANETVPKTKAELKAEAKLAKQVHFGCHAHKKLLDPVAYEPNSYCVIEPS